MIAKTNSGCCNWSFLNDIWVQVKKNQIRITGKQLPVDVEIVKKKKKLIFQKSVLHIFLVFTLIYKFFIFFLNFVFVIMKKLKNV